MPRWQPMQIVGGSYADDALPWSHQDTINYIPVPAEKEGVRSRAILRCAPGYSTFCDLGTNKPIRGARNVEGRLFVVSGTSLFQVNADGSSTERGTIPGVKRCSLSHNQITGGNEVVISNGQSGYVYNTVSNTLEQITDEAFAGSISFESLDSYILGIEPKRRFAFTSYLADATSYSTLDRYEAEGARSRAILRGAPGYSTFCDLGTNKPIRGARNVEGRLFVVSGTSLFQVNADGSSTERGTIPGVKRCSLSHNQITGGNEVVISNGQSGYVYNTVSNTLEQITDEAFAGSISFESVDSYILGIEPKRRFAFTSDLADATSYSTLDRYEAEGAPDLLVGQAVTHREWWLMGERTIEPFQNTGATTGTFQRAQGTVMEVGLAATHAVAVMDNSVFWLGSDNIPYRANGYTPERISTHAIEQAIARCDTSQAFAFTFEDRGHKIFYLTFPDGHTWGYDAATGEWHRRKSHNLDRWRVNTLTKWNGKWIAGDFSNGRLYQLDWKVQHEDGEVLERRRISGVTHDHQNALIINGLELVVDTGLPGAELVQPDVLSISGNLPDGQVGDAVNYQYTIKATHRPITVAIVSGALPTGLSIDNTGRVTSSVTANGSYSWTVRVTDANGATADVSDTASYALILSAQLSDWKYLQVAANDTGDYSAIDADDSSWSTGAAPFGQSTFNSNTNPLAPAYDSHFSASYGTLWQNGTRLWLRRTLALTTVPANGITIVSFIEDNYHFYLNGELVVTSPVGPDGGNGMTFTIDADKLVAGNNVIAIRCDDESPAGGTVYADMYLKVTP